MHPPPVLSALAWGAGIGSVAGADQAAKLASGRLDAVPGITPVRNPASTLAIIDIGRWPGAVLMLLGLVLAAAWLLPRAVGRQQALGAVLLLGGAAGNLVDRLTLGSVRDFLAIGPVVVNLADLAVVTGLALWLLTRLPRSRRVTTAPNTPTRRRGGEHPC